ncbi:ADCY3 [Cordylochernes scorpioides]|uniref:ADCY3 n=1 Tax=Cordylochernes scorpioides TaxID=51811 RepID=A0ABY6LPU3_9ARAC|nr:ADCY3 [Cordylochernes scorpioides]
MTINREVRLRGCVRLSSVQNGRLLGGGPALSLDESGLRRFLPPWLQFVFASREAERLYRTSCRHEKASELRALLGAVVLAAAAVAGLAWSARSWASLGAAIALAFLALLGLVGWRRRTPPWPAVLAGLAGLVLSSLLLADLWVASPPRQPADAVAWLLALLYACYVLLPLSVAAGLALGLVVPSLHSLAVGLVPARDVTMQRERKLSYGMVQLGANMLLFAGANLMGLLSFLFSERRQRSAFLETRQSLEAKILLEKESQKQVGDPFFFFLCGKTGEQTTITVLSEI